MKVVIFEAEEWEVQACASLGRMTLLSCTAEPLDETNAGDHADAEIVTTFVHSRIDADVLRALPHLRLIVTRSTGYDHIDLDFCREAGIAVANVPGYGDVTVAEHVFALLLGLARNLVRSVQGLREGRFDQTELRGFDLFGKTIGVVGTGRIGRRVVRIAQGFGMRVLAHDLQPDPDLARELALDYVPLDDLLLRSDVVTLHVPSTPQSRGLIGEAELARMKPEAILINTARGNIVDVEALVRALTGGRLRAAGLDVLPEEPLMRDEAEIFRGSPVEAPSVRALLANHLLLTLPNVLVTPHVAYNTIEARRRIIEQTVANITAFSEGRPINLV